MDKVTIGWLIAALACGIIEVVVPAFGFVLVSAAAVVAAILSAAGFGPVAQGVTFAVSCGFFLTVLRSYILSRVEPSPGVPSRTERLVGKTGRVTEAIDPATGGGRILVDGHDWAARASEPISAGSEVRVEGAEGIQLAVRRL
jgi:membrane protein implicated in regulation of membrane protease activity